MEPQVDEECFIGGSPLIPAFLFVTLPGPDDRIKKSFGDPTCLDPPKLSVKTPGKLRENSDGFLREGDDSSLSVLRIGKSDRASF